MEIPCIGTQVRTYWYDTEWTWSDNDAMESTERKNASGQNLVIRQCGDFDLPQLLALTIYLSLLHNHFRKGEDFYFCTMCTRML